MNASAIRLAGAGRAYQSVAQSTAIAIQDATDYLRNVSTISATATGVAMAYVVAGQVPKATPIFNQVKDTMQQAIQTYKDIGDAAIQIASNYPQSFG